MGCAGSRAVRVADVNTASSKSSSADEPGRETPPAPPPSDPGSDVRDFSVEASAQTVNDTTPPLEPPPAEALSPERMLFPEPRLEHATSSGESELKHSDSSSSFRGVPEDSELNVALEQAQQDLDGENPQSTSDRRQRAASTSSRSSRSSVERETFDELPDVPDNLLDMTDAELADVQDLDESSGEDDEGQYVTTTAPFANGLVTQPSAEATPEK